MTAADLPPGTSPRDRKMFEFASRDRRYAKHLPTALRELLPKEQSGKGGIRATVVKMSLPVLHKCANGGGDEDVIERCTECQAGRFHVRECDVHGTCTWESTGKPGVMSCRQCQTAGVAADGRGFVPVGVPVKSVPPDDKAFPPGKLEWVSTARLAADSVVLASKLPRDINGIVGLPRSGMIPASIIASHLHLPLYELTTKGKLNRLSHGSRGDHFGFNHPTGGRLAVVDDTVYSGSAMKRARLAMTRLGHKAVYAVVYSRLMVLPESVGAVDLYARELPTPHLLEWNVANNGPFAGHAGPSGAPYYRSGLAVDLDGIIVHDAESGGDVGEAHLVPRTITAPLIITGRCESTRTVTENHLRAVGVKWSRLEMLPTGEPADAQTIAAHKAKHYAASDCGFFVESDPTQAELIHQLTGRPVMCPVAGKVWDVSTPRTPPAALLPRSAVTHVFLPLKGKKVALVHSPATGNPGDRLIELAAEQLLTRFGVAWEVREPYDTLGCDVIALFGGGNYGHVHCKVEAERRRVALMSGLPCVLLPQTAYGTEPGNYTTAFARDVTSLNFITGSVLAPDLVMCYEPPSPIKAAVRARTEFFIRGWEGKWPGRGVDPRAYDGPPAGYLDMVAEAADVHTDSLHVAVCGLIARRSVTLYPTRLHKQKSVWETWLKDLGCKFCDS